MKMKRVSIDLTPETFRKLKIYCAERGKKMSDVLRVVIDKLLKGKPDGIGNGRTGSDGNI